MVDRKARDIAQVYQATKVHSNQHATCNVFAVSHNASFASGLKSTHDLSTDVIQCEVQDGFSGQQCSITLTPSKPYHEFLFPNDIINVYMSTNSDARTGNDNSGLGAFGVEASHIPGWGPDKAGENIRVFFGYIDAIRQSKAINEQGMAQVRVTIDCTGIQKPFTNTQIYYNEALGPNSIFGAMLPGLATLTKQIPLSGTATTIPRALALTFLGFGEQYRLPDNYPSANKTDREEILKEAFEKAKGIEESLGLGNTRIGRTTVKRGIVQRLWQQQKERIVSSSVASLIDLFSYTEDEYVDGLIYSTPNHDMKGSLLSMMTENVNPMMNELYFTLLPDPEGSVGKDEWGQYPYLKPCMVIREKPFSVTDDVFQVPSRKKGSKRSIKFGNVFFSSRSKPANVDVLQEYARKTFGLRLDGKRFVDRIKIHKNDIRQETLGMSDNDTRNFFMMSLTNVTLLQQFQKYVLLTDGLMPTFLEDSIARHGLRIQELTTKFLHTGASKVDGKSVFDFMIRSILAQDMWYQHNPYYRAGNIQVAGMPKARPGMVLDVAGDNPESYYVESVTHSWSHPGAMTTTFTVTRGQSQPTQGQQGFSYAPPHVVDIFRKGVPVSRANSAQQNEQRVREGDQIVSRPHPISRKEDRAEAGRPPWLIESMSNSAREAGIALSDVVDRLNKFLGR